MERSSALCGAAASWHVNTVALLLAKVPYEVDSVLDGLCAAVAGHAGRTVEFNGPKPSRTPVTADVELRQQRVVHQLVDAGANPHGCDGPRLLVAAAHLPSRLGVLKALLERGAHPNRKTPFSGKTVMHRLFRHGVGKGSSLPAMTPALRLLFQHGASPETADRDGELPVHAAAYSGTLEQLQLCVAACRDADTTIRLV